MALLAIVTVVRNDVAGLTTTMTSIVGQTTLPEQVVVVDGSDDQAAVPRALADFAELPVDYSWAQPRGVYAAMNDGLAQVTADYVYFLNAGDELHDADVVSDIVTALADSAREWAVGGVEFRAGDGTTLPEPPWDYDAERAALFARGRFPAHQGVVVRTSALRAQGGFDLRYKVAADYLSILRLARESAPLDLQRTLAVFVVGGLSTQDWKRGLQEFHRARRDVFRPVGSAAVAEQLRTGRTWIATTSYRTLWAPGRPLAGIVSRLRGTRPR